VQLLDLGANTVMKDKNGKKAIDYLDERLKRQSDQVRNC
jgi:hypothetical protein